MPEMLEVKNDYCIVFCVFKSHQSQEYFSEVLVESLKDTNPEISRYCLLNIHDLDFKLIKYLKKNNNIVYYKNEYKNAIDLENNYLRNYCCYYFSHIYDLTLKYKYVIYVDIDVVFLNKINFALPDNSLFVEEMPKEIKTFDLTYTSEHVFLNWIDVITSQNKFVHQFNDTYYNYAEREYSKEVLKSGLTLLSQNFGAIYPVKPLTKDSVCFHYDDVNRFSYFSKLKELYPDQYIKYKNILSKHFNVLECQNFWENLCQIHQIRQK